MDITKDKPISPGHQKVIDLYLSGVVAKEIANKLGKTSQGVYYILDRHGIKRRDYAENKIKRIYPSEILALAEWCDVTPRKAQTLLGRARAYTDAPRPLFSKLRSLGITWQRYIYAETMLETVYHALSIYPLPFLHDYSTGKTTRLSWVDTIKVVYNPLQWLKEHNQHVEKLT